MVSGASRAGEGDDMSKAMENAKRITDGDYDLHKAELDGCVSADLKPAQTLEMHRCIRVIHELWWQGQKIGEVKGLD
jgi:hypothetical protein